MCLPWLHRGGHLTTLWNEYTTHERAMQGQYRQLFFLSTTTGKAPTYCPLYTVCLGTVDCIHLYHLLRNVYKVPTYTPSCTLYTVGKNIVYKNPYLGAIFGDTLIRQHLCTRLIWAKFFSFAVIQVPACVPCVRAQCAVVNRPARASCVRVHKHSSARPMLTGQYFSNVCLPPCHHNAHT